MKLVLDASVAIDYLRRKDKENSWYFKAHSAGYDLVMSVVTVAEVFSGKSVQVGGIQKEEWELLLNGLEVVRVDLMSARLVGELRAKYELELGDAFVAALALKENLTLATLDRKAFAKVKGLKLFSVETKRKAS